MRMLHSLCTSHVCKLSPHLQQATALALLSHLKVDTDSLMGDALALIEEPSCKRKKKPRSCSEQV